MVPGRPRLHAVHRRYQHLFRVLNDTLDLIRGKHDIKVGMGVRTMGLNVGQTEGFQDGYWIITGLWTNDAVADFLLGLPSLAIHDQTFGGTTTGRRWKIFRPFVQDDWRITRSLTLNLGFAWNFTTPITEVANRQADFRIPPRGLFLIHGQERRFECAGIQMGIRPRSSRASASPGSPLACTALRSFGPAMACITILPGTRARKDCGRIHPITRNRIHSRSAARARSRRRSARRGD